MEMVLGHQLLKLVVVEPLRIINAQCCWWYQKERKHFVVVCPTWERSKYLVSIKLIKKLCFVSFFAIPRPAASEEILAGPQRDAESDEELLGPTTRSP